MERHLEGWHAKELLRVGLLVLLRSVLSVIHIFHLSIFKRARQEGFSGEVRGVGEGRGTVLVMWDMIFRSLHPRGLGGLHLQSIGAQNYESWGESSYSGNDELL